MPEGDELPPVVDHGQFDETVLMLKVQWPPADAVAADVPAGAVTAAMAAATPTEAGIEGGTGTTAAAPKFQGVRPGTFDGGLPQRFIPQTVPLPAPSPAEESGAHLAPPAGSQFRITLLQPDGKPFDGPVITTGVAPPGDQPKSDPLARVGGTAAARSASAGTAKAPARERVAQATLQTTGGSTAKLKHVFAALAIAAIGIVPLALMMQSSIHARLDKIALTVTKPTKVDELDSTAMVYLVGMALILVVVSLAYRRVLKRRS